MLPITPKVPAIKALQTTTLRGFSGGWNTLDDDMNLAYNYATKAKNIYFTSDGVAHVRYGCELFANARALVADQTAYLVNMEYFNGSVVAVFSNGQVVRIIGDGTTSILWSGWGDTQFASFAPFNGHLTIHNGSDKPIDIDKNFITELLQDAGTNTNINVPIGRYAVACQRYMIIAGDPLEPNRVHISARDAYGTYFGDPPPNDAVYIDVGSVLPNSGPIRGLLSFRDKLIVMFAEGVVIGTLGTYDANGNHTPDFNDAVQEFGGVSHRAASSHGDDAFILDLVGISSLRRTVLSAQLKPERISELIGNDISDAVSQISVEALEDNSFSVYDAREGQYFVFIPNNSNPAETTETRCFLLSYRPTLKLNCWSEVRGWSWTSGCRSLLGELFFSSYDGKIWRYGSRERPVYTDFVDKISSDEAPSYDPVGIPIEFEWELPWLDFKNRGVVKNSKYLGMDTRGAGEFVVRMYVDNIVTNPACRTGFSGGEQGGYGNEDQPYGGGRNTSYKKLYAWPTKFQIAKLNIFGNTKGALAFVSITIQYHTGGIRR